MKIRLPVSRETHERELKSIEETAAIVVRTTEAAKKLTDEHLTNVTAGLKETLSDYADLIAKYGNLEHKYASVCELNSARTRIGFIIVDAVEIEAKLRNVEPTIKVEFDGRRIFIYADRLMTTPEINQLEGMLKVQIDRT